LGRKDEQAIVKINNLVIKVESGIGNNTIPLLLLESSLSCNVKDWSSKRMTLIGSINVEMAYYNSKLALWEPVIEPIATQYKPDAKAIRKRWDMNVTLQQNASSDFGSAFVSPR
jgi:vacuolar protein sorting-associated protein 13A/C